MGTKMSSQGIREKSHVFILQKYSQVWKNQNNVYHP